MVNAAIDCIYMPLPTSLHVEWGVKAAKAGENYLVVLFFCV